MMHVQLATCCDGSCVCVCSCSSAVKDTWVNFLQCKTPVIHSANVWHSRPNLETLKNSQRSILLQLSRFIILCTFVSNCWTSSVSILSSHSLWLWDCPRPSEYVWAVSLWWLSEGNGVLQVCKVVSALMVRTELGLLM